MNHIQHVEKKCYVSDDFVKRNESIFEYFPEKYPQIKQLMGHDWRIAAQVILTVIIQITMAILVRDLPWKYVWLFTYIISGTLNHSLSISFHESQWNIHDRKKKSNHAFFSSSWT